MHLTLETKRTWMRPFIKGDTEEAFSWFGDPEVMKFAFGADPSIEATVSRINRYIEHQERWGFSKWIVIDREMQRPIGDAGFFQMPEENGIELGYRLAQASWGKGLATEIAHRWIEVASDFLDASTIFAYAQPENGPSFHVMKKVGFIFSRVAVMYGSEVRLFELPLSSGR